MTYLALFFSHYINGVSQRHHDISHSMFPAYPINSITNGVHAVTWTAPAFQELYDRHIPEWRGDNLYLRYAISIPLQEIQQAHAAAKRELLAEVKKRTRRAPGPDGDDPRLCPSRDAYKRADLLLSDPDRLRRIARQVGPLADHLRRQEPSPGCERQGHNPARLRGSPPP